MQIIDVTGAPLTPSYHGSECAGNGHNPDYEICCDNCDYYFECFPEEYEELQKSMEENRRKQALSKQQINLYELAKIFKKYDYFNDDKSPDIEYGVLLELYSILPQRSKDILLEYYNSMK